MTITIKLRLYGQCWFHEAYIGKPIAENLPPPKPQSVDRSNFVLGIQKPQYVRKGVFSIKLELMNWFE
jgi:hypothetical protein